MLIGECKPSSKRASIWRNFSSALSSHGWRRGFTKFNVFEALGVARRELHHSSFLAFLLDPSESHGLRELFLRRFLQETVRSAPHPVISAIELDAIDLKDIEIRREYENIDIFLRDRKNRILVIVENKVGSKQHDDQLERYYVDMTERHPGHRFLGVYLTASGETSENDNYVSASYGMVRRLVDELLTRESVLMPPNVRSVLEQYVDLLGRRFMADQELRELCESIYRQHRQAIDILHDNRPDPFSRVFTIVEGLVKESGFTPAESDNVAMRFIPQEFTIPLFKSDTAWLDERQMVYAECKKKAKTLVFQVKMDGGSMEERSLAHQFALTHKPFRPERTLYTKYQVLYTRTLLENVDVEAPDRVLKQRLTEEWEKVLTNELVEMRNACAGAASNDTSS